jgi:hypothetical protein
MQSLPDNPYYFYSEKQEDVIVDNPDIFLSSMAEIVNLSQKVQAEFPLTKPACMDWIQPATLNRDIDASSESDSTLIYGDTARHVEVVEGVCPAEGGYNHARKEAVDLAMIHQVIPWSSLTWKDHELYAQCLASPELQAQFADQFHEVKARIEFEQRVYRIWDRAVASLRRDQFDHFPQDAQQFTNVRMIDGRSY